MGIAVFISVLLAATAGTSAACLLYTIQGNLKSIVDKLLFALGICIMLWSFGLALQTAGAEAPIRFIGSRIAPVGYALMFALLLHYVLLLTRRGRLLGKWWIYPLIYLPGLLSVYGLTVRPAVKHLSDRMLETRFGWVNVSTGGWVNFYYVYYILFFASAVLLLWTWSRKTADESERKQGRLLLLSMLAGTVLGSLTDVGLVLLEIRIPSIASIFSVLPLFAVSYSVKRYGFMQAESAPPNEMILDRINRSRVYRVMGYCFIAGSLLNILSQRLLYLETALPSSALFSGILLLVGVAALFLDRLALDDLFKEFLFAALFSLVIPLVTLRFAVYSSITVWPFFILPLMISLLFNRRILLIVILLAAVQVQLLVWSITPGVNVTLDAADHMVRVGLIVLTAFISLYVNRIYRRRLRINAGYAYTQTLVSEISQSLVSVDESNCDEKIVDILGQCSAVLQCEQAYLMLWDQEKRQIRRYCQWVAGGSRQQSGAWQAIMALYFPKICLCFPESRPLVITDTRGLPQPLLDFHRQLLEWGMRSAVLIPIVKNRRGLGLMLFGTTQPGMDWERNPPQFLTVIANTVADTAVKLEDIGRIEWTAYHDLLTGLPNRLLFKQRLCLAVERAAKTQSLLGVAFIDLDSFKTINDTMSHEAGDLLLQEVAEAISAQLREGDTLARFGGDEFVLLLERVSSEDEVARFVRDISQAIQKPVIWGGREFYVTSSIGISLYPRDGPDAETLMKNADIAMYEAKGLGKNQYVLCSQPLKDREQRNIQLTNLLYRALEKDQLVVHYQPQIGLETGEIVGLEALLRWNLPEHGPIGPAIFIPLAEQAGLIQSIGAWVLESACRQNKRWQEQGFPPVRMAVNISVQQLESRSFVQQVADILGQTGLAPEYLELEVTESVTNSGAVDMVELLTSLKALGVSISIDDFGTEYSSLERLKLLPIDRIKIDMQFVQGIEKSDKDKAIAQVIINLAKNLNMRVIAEGVETAEQLAFLNGKLCDEVQGFYYFKPMPAQAVEAIFRDTSQRRSALPGEGTPMKQDRVRI